MCGVYIVKKSQELPKPTLCVATMCILTMLSWDTQGSHHSGPKRKLKEAPNGTTPKCKII